MSTNWYRGDDDLAYDRWCCLVREGRRRDGEDSGGTNTQRVWIFCDNRRKRLDISSVSFSITQRDDMELRGALVLIIHYTFIDLLGILSTFIQTGITISPEKKVSYVISCSSTNLKVLIAMGYLC